MMDGSLMEDGKTPPTFEYNVQVTREVVDMAHERGVTVEGELGCSGRHRRWTRRRCRSAVAPDRSRSGR